MEPIIVGPFKIHYQPGKAAGGYWWISYGGRKVGPDFNTKTQAIDYAKANQ